MFRMITMIYLFSRFQRRKVVKLFLSVEPGLHIKPGLCNIIEKAV